MVMLIAVAIAGDSNIPNTHRTPSAISSTAHTQTDLTDSFYVHYFFTVRRNWGMDRYLNQMGSYNKW